MAANWGSTSRILPDKRVTKLSGMDSEPLALVSGGASGIGAAVVERLRVDGSRVVVLDVNEPHDYRCDVSDPAAVDAAIAAIVGSIGVPTRVVTCAGIARAGLLVDHPPVDFRRVLDVNLVGTWLVMRAAAAAMIDANVAGSMVAVSSISGTLADRNSGAYCVSKAGVDMLVRVAAVEWGGYGIRVNAVGPGVTQTPMLGNASALPGWVDGLRERTALGRLGEPDDIAQAVVGLLELEWVTGQILHADGGLMQHSPIDSYGAGLRARRTRS
jgi:NAD(P)-dependent dehydrogenase (short-subunit alcohol dehydrogenase family)